MFLNLGTAAIAGLHVPGTKVICIEKDEETLELAKNRVAKFKQNNKFDLKEAYDIFAKCKLIPSKGALEAAGGLSEIESEAEDDEEEGHDDGDSDASEGGNEDEQVRALDLLECRLKLRPPADERLYRNGFLETMEGAVNEALSTQLLSIKKSCIEGAGNGVFANTDLSEGRTLLHYWGDIYAIPAEEVAAVVRSLKTVRMVETRKYVMKGTQKLK
jgi:hypothetical protein